MTESKKVIGAILPLIMVAIGIALMVFMIVVEDEPGAIPLLMITGGTIWYLVRRFRSNRS